MARVETDAQPIAELRAIHDHPELLKAATNLTPLARHRFEKHRSLDIRSQHRIQHFNDQPDTLFHALLHVGTRVEVVLETRKRGKPHQIIRHSLAGKLPDRGIRRTGVQRVGSVRQARRKTVFRGEREIRLHIFRILRLRGTASRVSRKELKGRCTDLHCFFSHREIALARRQVAADIQHFNFLFLQ